MPAKFTTEILAAALEGFEAQKIRLDTKITVLRTMLSGGPKEPTAKPEAPKRKKRRLSAAGRQAIIDAAKRRWAMIRAERQKASQVAAPKKTAPKKAAAKPAPVKKAAKKKLAAKKKTASAPAAAEATS